jgi:hypothetical protein
MSASFFVGTQVLCAHISPSYRAFLMTFQRGAAVTTQGRCRLMSRRIVEPCGRNGNTRSRGVVRWKPPDGVDAGCALM